MVAASWLLYLYLFLPPSNSVYYHISAEEFFLLPEANTPINLKDFDKELLEAAVFHATNQWREKRKLETLITSDTLGQAAKFHADYLNQLKSLSHENKKNPRFLTPHKRIVANGGTDFEATAENLALYSPYLLGTNGEYFIKSGTLVDKNSKPLRLMSYAQLAKTVVEEWSDSKGHRLNLKGNYNYLGCGVSAIRFNKSQIPEIIFVQNFGLK